MLSYRHLSARMLLLIYLIGFSQGKQDLCRMWASRCGAALKLSPQWRTTRTSDVCQLERDGFCMLNAVTPDGQRVVDTDCVETMPSSCQKRIHEHFCFEVGSSDNAGGSKHPFLAVRYSNGLYSIDQAGTYSEVNSGYESCRYWGKVENFVIGDFNSRQHIDAITVVHRPKDKLAIVRLMYVAADSWCSSTKQCVEEEEQVLIFNMDDYPVSDCAKNFGIFGSPFYDKEGSWKSQGPASEAGEEGLALVFGPRFTIPMPVEAVFYVDKSLTGKRAVQPRPSCAFLSIGNRAVAQSLVSHSDFVYLPGLGVSGEGLSAFLCTSDDICLDRTWHRRSKCHFDSADHPYGRCGIHMGFGDACMEEAEKLCVDGLSCVEGTCQPSSLLN